ncbi:hypothetical protein [Alicyclobacillus ferrooxydans]|uniref:Uncharacterized protein n=1 Tax=Alicyclobacillus ferrooxydans TaxID=471514 RepID=A0A0P9EQ67_9BACL|nr:hypothetical protein [Alicyclobacillus ferrooxydans]KPV45700.1 hypothetical protein AN477_02005 [Alicyclobacillus ferrooxydans]
MCNRMDCVSNMGKWVQFQTQWGTHRGIITDVNNRAVLVRVPRQYAPTGLVSHFQAVDKDDEEKLDLALAQWGGYGGAPGWGGGYGRPGYGAYGGRGWGRPGYGGWYGGWWWWWLAFAWIWWLAFLW